MGAVLYCPVRHSFPKTQLSGMPVKHHMGGTSHDVKRLKKMGFLPSLFWVFLTIYIFVALMKITMCFKQLEASHIMSCDS